MLSSSQYYDQFQIVILHHQQQTQIRVTNQMLVQKASESRSRINFSTPGFLTSTLYDITLQASKSFLHGISKRRNDVSIKKSFRSSIYNTWCNGYRMKKVSSFQSLGIHFVAKRDLAESTLHKKSAGTCGFGHIY